MGRAESVLTYGVRTLGEMMAARGGWRVGVGVDKVVTFWSVAVPSGVTGRLQDVGPDRCHVSGPTTVGCLVLGWTAWASHTG